MTDILALREKYQAEGRRNLVVPKNYTFEDLGPDYFALIHPRCECGNVLTIYDRGFRCGQCLLQERMR